MTRKSKGFCLWVFFFHMLSYNCLGIIASASVVSNVFIPQFVSSCSYESVQRNNRKSCPFTIRQYMSHVFDLFFKYIFVFGQTKGKSFKNLLTCEREVFYNQPICLLMSFLLIPRAFEISWYWLLTISQKDYDSKIDTISASYVNMKISSAITCLGE